jgi:hypothetical protein
LPNGVHSTALTNTPTDPNTSYKNTNWFKGQLSDMNEAGIDVALAVYWGDEEPSSDVGLANMVKAAQDLRSSGQATPTIGMFLDTGLIGRWSYGDRDLRKAENQDRVYELLKRFYTTVPPDLWGTIEGRPVMWLWGSWLDIRFNQAFFDAMYSKFEADFGVRPYIVADNSWRYEIGSNFFGRPKTDKSKPITVDDFYAWGASLDGYRDEGGNIAQVGPGYDERSLGGSSDRTGRFTDREDGEFYRRSWDAAMAAGKKYVAVETWNEFHEASGIADTKQYGRRYIDLTRELAERFKAGT